MEKMKNFVMAWAALALLLFASNVAQAISWQTSCKVDPGSIKREGGGYVFRTSKNYCVGGIFHQRAEINTGNFSISRRASYVFETTISMKSTSNEEFIFFQLHDGRLGCSPPLSLRWTSGNGLRFDSDYTRGKGMSGCVNNRSLRGARYTGPRLRRNGTQYRLRIGLSFDGSGGFETNVSIDGRLVLSGSYRPPSDPSFVASKRFYMKHGVYSQHVFDYEMRSKGMRVARGG